MWLAGLAIVALSLLAPRARAEEGVHRAEDIVVEEQTLRPAEIFEGRPVETEILTAEDIRALPAQNAADVVGKLPGVRTQARIQGEEDTVSIEGMPPEYTQVLVDGQRYTGEIDGVSDLRDLPLENVERIEILRGAQGLRYGSEAAGGLIRVVSQDPPDDGFRGQLDGGGGDQGNIQASGTVGYGNPTAGLSVSFDHDQIDGFETPEDTGAVFVGGNEDSRRLSRDANAAVRIEPAAGLSLRSRVGWRSEDQDLSFEDGGTAGRRDERWRVIQEAEWLATEATRLTGAFTWYGLTTESEVGREFRLEEHEWKLDLAGESYVETWEVPHTVTLGADLRLDSLDLDEGPLPEDIENPMLEDGAAIRETFRKAGLFLVTETELASWASLELGARLQLHSAFDPELLSQAALLLRPAEGLRIRLSWGRNHRAPSLRDLFQPPVPQLGGAYFLAGNPELTTESSTSWRVGFEWSPRSWISVSTVGFWNEIDDHIRSNFAGSLRVGVDQVQVEIPVARPGLELICEATGNFFPECAAVGQTVTDTIEVVRSAPLFRKTNLDSVRTRGIEARLELRPHPSVEVALGYTRLDTKVVDSNLVDLDELPNSPPHTVDARVRLTAPEVGTRLTVRGRWRDRALVEGSGTGLLSFTTDVRSDPSLVLDARLVQPLGEHVEVYADLRNLTDERVVDSLVVRGRTFFVGLRARFP